MLTKTILGLVTVFGLTGVGLSLAESRTGCCAPQRAAAAARFPVL